MGDYFINLIAPELDADGAEKAKAATDDYLIGNALVLPEKKDCVLGGDGFPPGPRFQELFSWPVQSLGLLTNGVQVAATKDIKFVDAGQGDYHFYCPSCRVESFAYGDERYTPWQEAMDSFFDGGSGLLACPHCDRATRVDQWLYVPHSGFSRFRVTFWNSPSLRKERVRELSELIGCPLQIVQGKR